MIVRELPPCEYARMREAGGPFGEALRGNLHLPDPAHTRIGVIEDATGAIKGYVVLFDALHVEPVWFDEDIRNRPKAGAKMLEWVVREVKATGADSAFGIILEADQATVAPFAAKLGFTPLPGKLYAVRVAREEEKT